MYVYLLIVLLSTPTGMKKHHEYFATLEEYQEVWTYFRERKQVVGQCRRIHKEESIKEET